MVSTLDSGGAEKQAVLLATQMSRQTNVNLIVLYGDYSEYERNIEMLLNSTVKVHKLSGNIISKSIKIRQILIESKSDVLLNYLTMPDFVGAIIGRICGLRVYSGIRSSRLPWGKMLMEIVVHNLLVTGTIYNCYSGADYFGNRGFKKSKNIVIPNCFQDIAEPIIRSDKKVKTIITVGRFVSQKDYLTLIKSVSLLNRHDFRLSIVGYGVMEDQIKSWINEYGIADKTDVYIKPNNVSLLEREADIYLSTSIFEGTSNSIMEALNCSLPVVATDVGDNSYLVKDGVNGFLHPVGDSQGLAGSLSRLLDSLELRNEMGVKSNRNLQENYSMEIFEKRYFGIIES